jgi:UDP-N-acetylmuramate--alanine ligase
VLGRTKRVHCVGVGGSGMSAVAEVLLRLGFTVSGSDDRPSPTTERLSRFGLTFHAGHAPEYVDEADVVVISSAVRPSNPEVVEANRRRIPVVPRAEMLAQIMRSRFSIAVAGAHGKTTTTAMIALMLERAGLDPTAMIGGRLADFDSNARVGRGEYLVAEADESDRSFLRLMPTMTVVTNIDREHLESYAGFDDLASAFAAFAGKAPFYGCAVLCVDDPHVRAIRSRVSSPVVTYGIDSSDADIGAREVTLVAGGSRCTVLDRRHVETALGELVLSVPGRHNVQNALAAVAVGLEIGVPFDELAPGLAAFRGAERRFELKGEANGVRVVDDYGHHPTEIAAVLQAARVGHAGRVLVAFQPHRYSRTGQLQDEFGPALASADAIVLTDIYPAGEDPLPGVTLSRLAESVERAAPGRVTVVPDLESVPAEVARLARAGDLVLTLGAGSIGETGALILEEIRRCR